MENIEFSPKYGGCAIVLNPFKCRGPETFSGRRWGSKTTTKKSDPNPKNISKPHILMGPRCYNRRQK